MNKINIKSFLLLSLLIFLAGCKDFLDIKPYDKTIPKTSEDFSALLHYLLEDIDYGEERIIGNSTTTASYELYADNLEANLTEYPSGNLIPLYIGSHLSDKQA